MKKGETLARARMLTHGIYVGLFILGLQTPCAAGPPYAEPSEKDMQEALERSMEQRGASRRAPGEVVTENAISGMSFTITQFEKLGCEPANSGPGYVCTYGYSGKMKVYSNEGTVAGNRHAQGANTLLQILQGGREETGGTATRRFLKGKHGWIASME